MIAVENWRGKGESKPTKKRRTYFSKNANALYVDLNSQINKKSIGVILNGSSNKIKCTIINKNKIELLNTCAFDTLIQLFACAATDCIQFGYFIFNENNSDLIFQLIRHLIQFGVTSTVYDLRANILYHIFPHDELLRSIIRIGCHCNIIEMVNKIFHNLPMAYEYQSCSNDQCSRSKKRIPIKSIPYSSHFENFEELEVTINDLIKPSSSNCICQGMWTVERKLSEYILIEVSNIPPGKNLF